MNFITRFFRSLRRDIKRWQNARKRARRIVYTWPRSDQRDWTGAYMKDLKTWQRS